MDAEMHDHTALSCLTRVQDGDLRAADELLPLVYDELRALAGAHLRQERSDHTLQPTALVHEAYLKLVDQSRANWKDRTHFFAVAAEAMRRVLVDHARGKLAAKRVPPGKRVNLVDELDAGILPEANLVGLDDALRRLAELNQRQARVVELRFFGGLSVEETADVLDVSVGTIKGDWRFARAWLQRELNSETCA